MKKGYTDGLLQLAIVLSLLRTDINNFLNSFQQNPYPEIQEIILGSSSAFTQTHFHQNSWNNDIGFAHPKSIDTYYSDSVFRELHSLGNYRRFDGVNTDINAWLISASNLFLPSESATTNDNDNDNHQDESQNQVANSHNDISTTSNISPQNDDNGGDSNPEGASAVSNMPSVSLGSELTKEDMDLIDVLWRQDMDLGVGREMFDLNLRRELEKEKEVELQKQREEERELEKLKEQQQQQQNITYVVDSETGELVAMPFGDEQGFTQQHQLQQQPQQMENLQNFNTQFNNEDNLSIEEAMKLLEDQTASTTMLENGGSLDLADVQEELEAMILNVQQMAAQATPPQSPTLNTFPATQVAPAVPSPTQMAFPAPQVAPPAQMPFPPQVAPPQPQPQQAGNYQRQNSLERALDEMASMFPMNTTLNTTVPENMAVDPLVDISMDNTTTDTPLLQNTTMTPAINPAQFANNFNMPAQPELASPMDYPMTPDMNPNITTLFPNASMINGSTTPSALFNMDQPSFMVNNMSATTPEANSNFTNGPSLLEQLMDDNIDMDFNNTGVTMIAPKRSVDELSSDSAVSSMGSSSVGSASPLNDFNETQSNFSEPSQFDGLEGATGGSDLENNSDSTKFSTIKTENFAAGYYGYGDYTGFGGSNLNLNHSGSSNTSSGGDFKPADMRHIKHNHTYPLQPGQQPKERKGKDKEDKLLAGLSRDEKKMKQMKVPFTQEEIVNSPVDAFNDMLRKYKLNESQLTLIRDIRRRGKNKVAAQNCRKRKMEVVETLEEEIIRLKKEREAMMQERHGMDKEVAHYRKKMSELYQEVFSSLRDDNGDPYDPNEYILQQTADNVFLVPRNSTRNSKDSDEKPGPSRKRRGKKHH